jgi:hypothetical protein
MFMHVFQDDSVCMAIGYGQTAMIQFGGGLDNFLYSASSRQAQQSKTPAIIILPGTIFSNLKWPELETEHLSSS